MFVLIGGTCRRELVGNKLNTIFPHVGRLSAFHVKCVTNDGCFTVPRLVKWQQTHTMHVIATVAGGITFPATFFPRLDDERVYNNTCHHGNAGAICIHHFETVICKEMAGHGGQVAIWRMTRKHVPRDNRTTVYASEGNSMRRKT